MLCPCEKHGSEMYAAGLHARNVLLEWRRKSWSFSLMGMFFGTTENTFEVDNDRRKIARYWGMRSWEGKECFGGRINADISCRTIELLSSASFPTSISRKANVPKACVVPGSDSKQNIPSLMVCLALQLISSTNHNAKFESLHPLRHALFRSDRQETCSCCCVFMESYLCYYSSRINTSKIYLLVSLCILKNIFSAKSWLYSRWCLAKPLFRWKIHPKWLHDFVSGEWMAHWFRETD
jgi:hypothetical protein